MKIILLFLFHFTLVKAIIPSSRYNGGCTLVNQKIYCYGGTSDQRPTSDHYMLDLSQDFTLNTAINNWQSISSPDFVLEPNSLFSIISLNHSYLIHGGLGYGSSQQYKKNITVLFDTTNLSWTTIADNKTLPSREGSATLDTLGRAWLWGGLSDNTSSPNITTTIYHNELTVLNTQNFTWSFPNNQTNSTSKVPSFVRPRLEHTATLTQSGNSIYFIGGLEVTEDDTIVPAAMDEILEFDLINSTWKMHKTSNKTVPSHRRLHSATEIPNSDLILMYGGSFTDSPKVVSDYIYLLNTTSFEWSMVNITNSDQGAGPRFGHSAVLYKNHSLFIIFGVDTFGLARNDFFLLDVGNWQWVTGFKTNDVYQATIVPSSSSKSVEPKPSATGSTIQQGSATSGGSKRVGHIYSIVIPLLACFPFFFESFGL